MIVCLLKLTYLPLEKQEYDTDFCRRWFIQLPFSYLAPIKFFILNVISVLSIQSGHNFAHVATAKGLFSLTWINLNFSTDMQPHAE